MIERIDRSLYTIVQNRNEGSVIGYWLSCPRLKLLVGCRELVLLPPLLLGVAADGRKFENMSHDPLLLNLHAAIAPN